MGAVRPEGVTIVPSDFRLLVLPVILCGVLAGFLPDDAGAQGQAAEPWEAGCLIKGLNPNGDNFLSIRRGPGTGYEEIARVTNGDALFLDTRKCQGKWCLAEGGAVSGQNVNIQGWFYTAWCEFYP